MTLEFVHNIYNTYAIRKLEKYDYQADYNHECIENDVNFTWNVLILNFKCKILSVEDI